MPSLFIITGSNGAGKSTIGSTYLPSAIQGKYIVFDGDKLAMQKRLELRTLIPSFKEAKKIADEWVNEQFINQMNDALARNDHFVYEGHFRDKSPLGVPRKFKRKGYFLSLIFMGLASSQQSELRVIDRAKYGGHNVPLHEIEANFYGNLAMLNEHYKLFNEIIISDTSDTSKPVVLLHVRNKEILSSVSINTLPEWFIKYLHGIYKLMKKNN